MLKFITADLMAFVALAAFAASLTIVIATPAPVLAQQQVPLLTKADRLPQLLTGAACSARGWPNYEQRCQFDLRRPAGALSRTVRVIAMR